MLTLDSAGSLLTALKRLNSFQFGLTPASANAHIWLEQVENQLKLVANTIDGSWSTQWIPSPNTVNGVRFLISNLEVPRILKTVDPKLGLRIQAAEGGAQLTTFNSLDESGEPIVAHTILVRTYYGDSSEFGPVPEIEEPSHVVRLKASDYLAAIALLKDYGTYSKDSVKGRSLLFRYVSETNLLEVYGSQDKNPNYFCRFQVLCEASCEDFEFVFQGLNLDLLSNVCTNLESEVSLNFDISDPTKPVLYAKGDVGSVYIQGEDRARSAHITGPAEFFNNRQALRPVSYRIISCKTTERALAAQEPPKGSAIRQIKIEAEAEHLIMSKVEDFDRLEYSRILNEDPEAISIPFPVLKYNVDALQRAISTLNTFRVRYGLDSDLAAIEIYQQDLGPAIRWLTKLTPVGNCANRRSAYEVIGIVDTAPNNGL